ncbi:melanotransferrin [Macrosteles quadrilineatus]|uniref:melanotransferrin n=1 Tax=Macrosteles quadrilineatus TaxID=74068 RepID=UPI0023E2CF3B|nr:melanotransferrin [Macrosteles quadrilineatus]
MEKNFIVLFILGATLCILYSCHAQNAVVDMGDDKIIWCVISQEEMFKCQNFSVAVKKEKNFLGPDYLDLQCIQGFNKEECMFLLDQEKAHVTTLDAGDVFIGGRYHSLIPIMQEVYEGGSKFYYSTAVIKKGTLTDVSNIRQIRGKKVCFPGVGSLAGWIIPIHELMRNGGLDIIDCNNHVKNAINFFGPSCAVNSLIDKNNPIGDNSDKLCRLCIGRVPGERCTPADPYAGFEGAFKCLVEVGEIAFLKHTTVMEMTANNLNFVGQTKDNFELLCKDGSRHPVDDFKNCNWGTVPSHAVVTTSAKSNKQRTRYQKFLIKAVRNFGGAFNLTLATSTTERPGPDYYSPKNNQGRDSDQNYRDGNINNQPWETNNNPPWNNQQNNLQLRQFHMFESAPRYGLKHNLMFLDSAVELRALEESKQTYSGYLSGNLDIILGVRQCPVNSLTLCVTSDPEHEKCIKMRTALKAQLLKPEMVCHKAHSQINCMQAIKNGNADVAVFDAGDVYTAGLNYDLIPFMAEIYNLGSPDYYVVAVAKEEDASTEITYLKGKNTCHTGINTAAGWIVPMAYLLSNNWMRSYGCDSVRAAAEWFSKSCVPGALSTEYNTGVPYENMCHLCHGASFRDCRRDHSEDYYGYTGALRCLVEGGGDVAFVKHTTVLENTDGKRKEWWARNALNEDFELLCPDGTRALMSEYKRCNLGKAKANALVARGGEGYNQTELQAYINLFIYAQQFYGRKDPDDFSFSMFYSPPPYADLIFQDAAQQLAVLKPEERWYSTYLGKDFMRARRLVDCHAGTETQVASFALTMTCTFITAVLAVVIGRF